MKKELIAAILLIVLMASCVLNMRYMSNLTDEIVLLINEAEKHASEGDWDSASEKAELALTVWSDHDMYISIILPHNDSGQATDALYNFLGEIYAQNTGRATAAAQLAAGHFNDIAFQERISLGSVF